MKTTVIMDVDGTLVDTNYHHAIAWHRALRAHGYSVPMWRIHRHIGMGGDQMVPALIGDEAETRDGEAVRAAEADAYDELIGEIEPMGGAKGLLANLCAREDFLVVLASSAKQKEVDHYLDLLDARELVDAWTTSADVERTKPAADLVQVALEKVPANDAALMVGDTVWDVKAASAAGVSTLAVLTGGFSREELCDAGAAEVVESIEQVAGSIESFSRSQVG